MKIKNLNFLKISKLYVKDESNRFGLDSFKVLGGSYAVNQILKNKPNVSVFCTATDGNISQFNITNPPEGATSFTIRISQDANGGDSVAIDTFKFNGNTIPVYWPGGVVPTVTTTANKTDIYSFKIFDGSNISTVGMYGIVGGQNFS